MKHSGIWLLFQRQHWFVPKHVTLSQKIRLALLVSIPASCFFDQQAAHDKNSTGDNCGFPNWDWKISKQSLFLFLSIARRPHITQSDLVFLNLSGASCIFGHVDIKWVTFMCAGGRYVNPNLFQWEVQIAWQSFCADTSPKWEVSTPCPKTKRTREDAILKRETGHFSPLFNATCEVLQLGQSGVLRG